MAKDEGRVGSNGEIGRKFDFDDEIKKENTLNIDIFKV